MKGYKNRIENGMRAYGALQQLVTNKATASDRATFKKYEKDLGYGLLLKKYTNKVTDASPAQIQKATRDAIPQVSTCFWAFRIMIGCWGLVTLLMLAGIWFCYRNTLEKHRWFLRFCLYAIPLPYIAAEFGWILAEVGRQPWSVHQILPTYLGVSSLSVGNVITSLGGFILFYVSLFCIELFLMFKYGRLGPSSLYTGRYHFEKEVKPPVY